MKYLYLLALFFLYTQLVFAQTQNPTSETENRVNPYAEKPLTVDQFLYFDSELIRFDFEAFQPFFHVKNIDLLEKSKLLWGVEYGVRYKSLFFGANVNFGAQSSSITDSIDAKTNYTRFGLSGGYYVLNTKHIQIVPRTSLYINTTSLKNFSSKDDIPLEDYTSNPDFKLNFRQYTLQLGLDINLKISSISTKPGQPFLVGFKTGYNMDLGDTRLKSEENTLKSKSNISVEDITFGFHFTMLL